MARIEYPQGGDDYLDSLLSGASPLSRNPIHIAPGTPSISSAIRRREALRENPPISGKLRVTEENFQRSKSHLDTPPSEPRKTPSSSHNPIDITLDTPSISPSVHHAAVIREGSEPAAPRTPRYYGTKLYKTPSPSSESTNKSLEPSSTLSSTPLHQGAKHYKVSSPSFESKDRSLELSSAILVTSRKLGRGNERRPTVQPLGR